MREYEKTMMYKLNGSEKNAMDQNEQILADVYAYLLCCYQISIGDTHLLGKVQISYMAVVKARLHRPP